MQNAQFSWLGAAGTYSAVAGFLAGFTINAIILMLSLPPIQRDPSAPHRDDLGTVTTQLFYSLFATFFTLTVAAFLFAVTQGEPQTESARTYVLGVGASSVFVIGVLELLLSIVWCVREYRPSINLTGAYWFLVALLFIIAADLTVAYGELLKVKRPDSLALFTTDPWLLLVGFALLLVAPGLVGIVTRYFIGTIATRKHARLTQWSFRIHTFAITVTSCAVVVAAMGSGIMTDVSSNDILANLQPYHIVVAMALVGVVITCLILALPYRRAVAAPESAEAPATSSVAVGVEVTTKLR